MTANQITPAIATQLPEFNPLSISPNTTYIVSTNIAIPSDILKPLPENVTLVFAGGKLTGNTTLKGNNTQIVANMVQIFDIGLELTGSWITDRAYPQWWGAKNTYDSTNPNYSLDATAAINKAIKFKRTGEVFIPRGTYLVAGTIEMSTGIILKGEKAYPRETLSGQITPQNDFLLQGTALVTKKGALDTDYQGGYMLLMNIDTREPITPNYGTWVTSYPEFHTAVHDLNFHNDGIVNMKCILAGGGFDIQYCRWSNFCQAVASIKKYSDLKSVDHCAFSDWSRAHSVSEFAFDFNIGDAVTFKNVHIYQDDINYRKYKALRVNTCNSAEIANNIFNSSVEISTSKAINFTSNHLESPDTQLTVSNSVINISDNYFEKGTKPCIILKGDTVNEFNRVVATLNNNFFGFYDNDKDKKNTISAYDIQTNGSVNFSINRSYRYWVTRNLGHRVVPHGVMICDSNGNPVTSFNNHSYVLSNNGNMMPDFSVSNNNSVILNQNLTCTYKGANSNMKWFINSGSYTYRAQILWDKTRKIIGNNIVNIGALSLTKNGPGASFAFGGINEGGFNCIIRLERTGNGQIQICDVPVCGALHLYDNGENVCGYIWETGTLTDGLAPLYSMQFTGKNVICRATKKPVIGTWTDGDIVYNAGNLSTCTLWIRYNGAFVERL